MGNRIKYNKLVRDKIPEIIEEEGKEYEVRRLDEEQYRKKLKDKLREEVDEYLETQETEELADVLEVIYALASLHGENSETIEQHRIEKKDKRGGFDERILLVEVEG